MANALYDKGREGFLDGTIDWDTNQINVALVSSAYVVNLATHDFWDDVSANVVGTPQALTGKTVTAGVADASDVTFTAVTGSQVNYLVIYQHNASPAAARLIAYIDTGTGLPVTPNGGDIIVVWDNGANRIFKL